MSHIFVVHEVDKSIHETIDHCEHCRQSGIRDNLLFVSSDGKESYPKTQTRFGSERGIMKGKTRKEIQQKEKTPAREAN